MHSNYKLRSFLQTACVYILLMLCFNNDLSIYTLLKSSKKWRQKGSWLSNLALPRRLLKVFAFCSAFSSTAIAETIEKERV